MCFSTWQKVFFHLFHGLIYFKGTKKDYSASTFFPPILNLQLQERKQNNWDPTLKNGSADFFSSLVSQGFCKFPKGDH